jgi:hypothetical protein
LRTNLDRVIADGDVGMPTNNDPEFFGGYPIRGRCLEGS